MRAAADQPPSDDWAAGARRPGYATAAAQTDFDVVPANGRPSSASPGLRDLKYTQERLFTAPMMTKPSVFARDLAGRGPLAVGPGSGHAPGLHGASNLLHRAGSGGAAGGGKRFGKTLHDMKAVYAPLIAAAEAAGVARGAPGAPAAYPRPSSAPSGAKGKSAKPKNKLRVSIKAPRDYDGDTSGDDARGAGYSPSVAASIRELDAVFQALVAKVQQLERCMDDGEAA